jgi:Flp pilus assembly protein TadB
VNTMRTAAAVMVVLGAALWSIVRSMRRAPVSVALARAAMSGSLPNAGATTWRARATEGYLSERLGRHFGTGLEVIDWTPVDAATRVLVAAVTMTSAVGGAVAALVSMGLLPLHVLWLVAPVLCGAFAAWVQGRDIASRIERRRNEYRQAANDFVQLVAVGLTTDQSVEEAVGFALGVGATDAFERLRTQVAAAPARGIPVWEAIDDFGRRYQVRELCEFASSVERQGLQGVSITETVGGLAAAMRATSLDALEREADRANANLSGPTIGFVVATIVFLAYPLAQRISDAFGG